MKPKPLQHLPEAKRTSWLRNILAISCLLLTSSPLFSQTKTVTGTVTDLDGNYSISVTPDNALEFSYVGMQKQTIPVGLQTVISVAMKDGSQMLGETVVIGYGSAKKRDLTGSITNIKGYFRDELEVPFCLNTIRTSGRDEYSSLIVEITACRKR